MTTRREFLAGITATLLAGTMHAKAEDPKAPRLRAIDIHAHWYPPEWAELVEREGQANGAKIGRNQRGYITVGLPGIGAVLQQHYIDIPSRLERMDKAGVAMHALSLTQPMVYWAPPAFGLRLAQAFNDACTALHVKYPDRFVGLAQLPMQDVELAVGELERVARRPGIRGVYMATHVNGKNLDDKSLWPVYAGCERHSLAIFLHPINPVGADRMRSYHLRNFIGNPTDTGIAAASLMFGGVLDAYPKLDVVLPHAGGVFPALVGRMRHGATVRAEVKDLPKPPPEYVRRFHYDTIAHDKEILLNVVREVGVDRVVCGTDFPADMSDVDPVGTVERLTELSAAEREMILRGNAARLLKL